MAILLLFPDDEDEVVPPVTGDDSISLETDDLLLQETEDTILLEDADGE